MSDNTPRITPEELARLKELETQATGAPWAPSDEASSHFEIIHATNAQYWVAHCYNQKDTDFIAALRNAAPALLHAAEAYSELFANGWRVYRSLRGVSVPEASRDALEGLAAVLSESPQEPDCA